MNSSKVSPTKTIRKPQSQTPTRDPLQPEGERGQKHTVTLYAGARDPEPKLVAEKPWNELADRLSELANRPTDALVGASPEEQKRRMAAWSPHRLRPDTTRAEANVEEVTLLVLDVDAGDPDAVAARMVERGWAGLLYESPSSTDEAPRFRVVSPITSKIAPDDSRETRLAFAEALGLEPGCGVEGAVDASKLFFAGCTHGTRPRGVMRVEGKPVDVATLPAPVKAWGAAKAPAVDVVQLAELPTADNGIAASLGDWRAHTGRKWDLCGDVGGLMYRAGYTRMQCAAVIAAWLPADEPTVDVDAGIRWALGAWDKDASDVTGPGALAARLGAEHAAVVCEAVRKGSAAVQAVDAMIARARESTAPWDKGVTGDERNPFANLLSMADTPEDGPIEYYCEGLRLAPSDGKISLIAGLPGQGKGPLADYLAVCFALGAKAFGRWPCRKSRVLLIDVEGARLTRRRIVRLCRGLKRDPKELADLVVFDASKTPNLLDLETQLREFITRERFDVVILDSYTTAMLNTGADFNKPEFAVLAQVLGSLGILVIAVAHARKLPEAGLKPTLSDVAGSFALAALAATGIVIWHPDAKDDNRVRVACLRAPEQGFEPFDMTFTGTATEPLVLAVTTGDEAAQAEYRAMRGEDEARLNRILDALHASEAGYAGGALISDRAIGRMAAGTDQESAGRCVCDRMVNYLLGAGILREATGGKGYVWEDKDVTRIRLTDDGRCVPAKPAPAERGPGSFGKFGR
jgi:hypothetical protein